MQHALSETLNAHNTLKPSRGPSHFHLDAFTGRWKSEGTNFSADGKSENFFGEDCYEWLTGEFFLVNRFDRPAPSGAFSGMGWIGYDPVSGGYLSYSISNLGYLRIYEVEIIEGEMRFTGDHERAVLQLSPDRHELRGHWEQSQDGHTWKPLCDFNARRAN